MPNSRVQMKAHEAVSPNKRPHQSLQVRIPNLKTRLKCGWDSVSPTKVFFYQIGRTESAEA